MKITSARRVIFALAIAAALAGCGQTGADLAAYSPPAGSTACPTDAGGLSATCSLWMRAVSPDVNDNVQGWATGVSRPVAVNAISDSGLSSGYMVDPSRPSDPLTPESPDCFTCGITDHLEAGIRRVAHPQLQAGIAGLFSREGTTYAVVTVQDPASVEPAVYKAAKPGVGIDNDIYIAAVTPSGALGPYWLLYRMPTLGVFDAVIWPEVNGAGSEIVWSQMYQYFAPLGAWQLYDAPLVWNSGVPTLGPTATYPHDQPGRDSRAQAFYEPYGFSPTGRVIFSSSLGHYRLLSNIQTNNQIFTIDAGFAQAPVAVSDGVGDDEFAFFHGPGLVIYGGTSTQIHPFWRWGLDYWVQPVDPATEKPVGAPHPLTGFNHLEYADLGSWAVDPADPDHVLFSVCEGAHQTLLSACSAADVYSMTLSS